MEGATNPLMHFEWFHGTIDRREAELRLTDDFSFLVRSSREGSGHVLSIRSIDGILMHSKISEVDGKHSLQGQSFDFSSISDLIQYNMNRLGQPERRPGFLPPTTPASTRNAATITIAAATAGTTAVTPAAGGQVAGSSPPREAPPSYTEALVMTTRPTQPGETRAILDTSDIVLPGSSQEIQQPDLATHRPFGRANARMAAGSVSSVFPLDRREAAISQMLVTTTAAVVPSGVIREQPRAGNRFLDTNSRDMRMHSSVSDSDGECRRCGEACGVCCASTMDVCYHKLYCCEDRSICSRGWHAQRTRDLRKSVLIRDDRISCWDRVCPIMFDYHDGFTNPWKQGVYYNVCGVLGVILAGLLLLAVFPITFLVVCCLYCCSEDH